MANVIRHKRGTSDPTAGDFSNTGELLINTTDGGLFTKTDGGSVVEIGGGGGGGGATDIDGLSDGTTQGSENVGLGIYTLDALSGGTGKNTALGYAAASSITTNGNCTAVGNRAAEFMNGQSNTAIGSGCMTSVTGSGTGSANTGVGFNTLNKITTGTNNIALGQYASFQTTSGTANIAIGASANTANTTGNYGVLIGHNAGYNLNGGNDNIAIGRLAIRGTNGSATGYRNIGIGLNSLYNLTSGSDNVAIGYQVAQNTTTGTYSVYLGTQAGYSANTGARNVAIGYGACFSNTSAQYITAIGWLAGMGATGDNGTFLGANAGDASCSGQNNTCIGYQSDPSSSTVSNEITLGNSSVTTLRCNTQTISSLSDGRDKTDVEDLPAGLSFIDSLRPVKFKWKTRDGNGKDGTYEAGFIAQDLQAAQSDAAAEYLNMVMDENPDRLEARYGQLIPVLVQAIKELKSEVEQLKANAHES